MADEPKPEERARVKIDEQLVDAGWHIADRSHFTYDHNATALTEGLLDGNHEANRHGYHSKLPQVRQAKLGRTNSGRSYIGGYRVRHGYHSKLPQ